MKILISPAKKMRSDPDTLAPEALPALLPETERLLAALRAMTPGELQALWRCSDAIAAQNLERLRDMDLRRRLTPASLAFAASTSSSVKELGSSQPCSRSRVLL